MFMKGKEVIILILLLILCENFVWFFHILHHEQAHYIIYRYFGINSTIKIGYFQGITLADEQKLSEVCEDVETCKELKLLHLLNDIVGYNILVPLILTNSLLVLLVIFLLIKS